MKFYTITASCPMMPLAYIARDEIDYYFTTTLTSASMFSEDDIDLEVDHYSMNHPEYLFTKREVVSK